MSEAQLYLGDCLDFMTGLPDGSFDTVITDPPYGISVQTNYRERKRTALALCNNFEPIQGDDKPFDPQPFLSFPRVLMFGPNYYADKLTSGSWHVWDKIDGLTSSREIGFNDNSDCEFIWYSRSGASRIFRHRWMGAMKASEQDQRRMHPTQKPVALMVQLILAFTEQADTIFDPYMGVGTTGVACMQTGRNFIGCEIDPGYFKIAEKCIRDAQQQPLLPFGADETQPKAEQIKLAL